jgi:hypothetical protein
VVGLVDDHDLEALAGRLVDLLRLGHFLEEVLHHDAVIVADIGGCDFEVVDGGDDVKLELAVGRGLEDTGVDLDLLDAGAVEFLQSGYYPRLLPGAGGSVDEDVRKVAALRLDVS